MVRRPGGEADRAGGGAGRGRSGDGRQVGVAAPADRVDGERRGWEHGPADGARPVGPVVEGGQGHPHRVEVGLQPAQELEVDVLVVDRSSRAGGRGVGGQATGLGGGCVVGQRIIGQRVIGQRVIGQRIIGRQVRGHQVVPLRVTDLHALGQERGQADLERDGRVGGRRGGWDRRRGLGFEPGRVIGSAGRQLWQVDHGRHPTGVSDRHQDGGHAGRAHAHGLHAVEALTQTRLGEQHGGRRVQAGES